MQEAQGQENIDYVNSRQNTSGYSSSCFALFVFSELLLQKKNQNEPSAIPLKKCSCVSLVAPSLNAIIPASTQTAFN